MELLVLAAIVLLGFAGVVVYILYRMWRRGGAWKLASASLGTYIAYSVITAIWPPNSFYIDEFNYRSGLALPDAADVLDKDSSYPDFHGDYFSKAVIRLDQRDFVKLKSKIAHAHDGSCFVSVMAKKHLAANIHPVGCWSISKNIDDRFEFVLFSDERTIYFEFSQT